MGVADQLRIEVRHDPSRAVLSLSGELDMASAELLAQALEEEGTRDQAMVVLDLQGLQFIDSTGLRGILTALERCRERHQGFAVTPGSQQVQRLLSITGMADHLPTIGAADGMVA
jgi:anti-sigma B factor antagonist